MQNISTHLWFDKEAKEAAAFYLSALEGSVLKSATTLHGTPSGDCDMLHLSLSGSDFYLISAGPYFSFTPAVSFIVACEKKQEVDALYATLSDGGSVLMELSEYPFSARYAWITDKYGVSWQLMYTEQPITQKITPSMMFVGKVAGKAEEAMNFYASIFPRSNVTPLMRYVASEAPEREGTLKFGTFTLFNKEFAGMDSAREHDFTFNEAISFLVHCDTQEEIDNYWNKLSAVPEAEQCGWLKDRYGFSWQIVPSIMDEMLTDKNEARVARVTEAFLKMKKFDIAALKHAFSAD